MMRIPNIMELLESHGYPHGYKPNWSPNQVYTD